MNRRTFFKLIGIVPLAPSVLVAMPVKAKAKPGRVTGFMDFSCCYDPVPPIDIGDGLLLIDYYRVVVQKGKTHLEVRYKGAYEDWKVLKRTYDRDNINGFVLWATPCCVYVEFLIHLNSYPKGNYWGVRLK